MGFVQEFKEFAVKGNALDMAVGIIVGAAFTKIVNSLVADIIMPPIGMAIGGVDFKHLELVLKPADTAANIPAVAVRYGNFLNSLIEFGIVAFSVFMMIKVMLKVASLRVPTQLNIPGRAPKA